MGSSAEYLYEPEIKWRELPTVRSSSSGSGERRLGVGAIPAKGVAGVGPDQLGGLGKEVRKRYAE
jgi:hypothetical protein